MVKLLLSIYRKTVKSLTDMHAHMHTHT